MSHAPRLEAGEVHIWCVKLACDSSELGRLEGLLVPAELSRADRLLDRQARDRYVAGRGFLRQTLGPYLGMLPQQILISEGEHGKPFLAGNDAAAGAIRFNLSHAGNLALFAMASEREVGIDVEEVSGEAPILDMAKISFSDREREELLQLPQELQRPAFYRCWTRKEAYLKGCGLGFSLPSDSFDVSLLPESPPALIAHRLLPDDPVRWRLLDLAVPEGFCAALAVEGRLPIIRYVTTCCACANDIGRQQPAGNY